ncbi:J domain-containing protein [Peptoniphilus equinus]|uniref:J domain-containing protein n=1 Tax=Peptoniphilus equinus TaxID=3016343 RepID=A0ABY7QU63_9FIRM|nr:J domain-containing protein [Peptoniphilus equinus]WBW50313.1 J domain-containing protein [Peptoniphilus equinus]
MKYRDYYEILGVDKHADEKAIKRAYRKLAKKYHPDVNGGDAAAQEKFKEVTEAYEVLSDPDKKQKYDTFGSNYDFQNGTNFDPSQYGYSYTTSGTGDFSDFFETFFGSDAHRGRGFNFQDIFSGGASRGRETFRQKYDTSLNITLDEAYRGTTKNVTLDVGGRPVEIAVKVPRGITPGKKIKIKGDKYGVHGDILFKIDIQTGTQEELDGLNIVKEVDIYPWQAALSDTVMVQTLEGKIKVKIPEGYQPKNKMRIPHKGFRDMKGNEGDLYIQFRMMNPQHLTEAQLAHYRALKELEGSNA